MNLQDAIDIAHDIREQWPHVQPVVVDSGKPRRDGNEAYIIGVYRLHPAGGMEHGESWVISSTLDWEFFLKYWRIFA